MLLFEDFHFCSLSIRFRNQKSVSKFSCQTWKVLDAKSDGILELPIPRNSYFDRLLSSGSVDPIPILFSSVRWLSQL